MIFKDIGVYLQNAFLQLGSESENLHSCIFSCIFFWGLLAPLEAGGDIAALGCKVPCRTRLQGGTSPLQPPPPPHHLLLPPSDRREEVRGERGTAASEYRAKEKK